MAFWFLFCQSPHAQNSNFIKSLAAVANGKTKYAIRMFINYKLNNYPSLHSLVYLYCRTEKRPNVRYANILGVSSIKFLLVLESTVLSVNKTLIHYPPKLRRSKRRVFVS